MAVPSARRIRAAGLSLVVYERGEAGGRPTVVLLHGYPDTAAVWDLVAEQLATQFHVVTYDVRGAGESDTPDDVAAYRLPLLMADLEAVLDATSPGEPVHLVGHDWGSLQGWEAVATPALAGRIASYTTISGPSLDHVATWVRQRVRHPSLRGVRELAGQAVRSSYIAAFHIPGVAWAARRIAPRAGWMRARWTKSLTGAEPVRVDERWPSASFGRDLANGMSLYRANIGPKLRHGVAPRTDLPLQIIVARDDAFVPPSLLAGLEDVSPRVWWREIDAGHWVSRSHPDEVAGAIADLVEHLGGGEASPELAGSRVRSAPRAAGASER